MIVVWKTQYHRGSASQMMVVSEMSQSKIPIRMSVGLCGVCGIVCVWQGSLVTLKYLKMQKVIKNAILKP